MTAVPWLTFKSLFYLLSCLRCVRTVQAESTWLISFPAAAVCLVLQVKSVKTWRPEVRDTLSNRYHQLPAHINNRGKGTYLDEYLKRTHLTVLINPGGDYLCCNVLFCLFCSSSTSFFFTSIIQEQLHLSQNVEGQPMI